MKQRVGLVLTLLLLGCGNGSEADAKFREHVAKRFMADCKQSPAPTAALAKELDQLCSCTVAEIRSSDIAYGDPQKAIDADVADAMTTCTGALYGEEQPKK